MATTSRMLLDKSQVLLDVFRGADHEGHPLVQGLWLDVQYPLGAGGCHASRLLDEEGDGVALVQQPQLSLGALLIGGVHEDPSVGDGAVNV